MLFETARLLEKENIKIETVIFGAIFPPKHVKFYGNFFDPWMLYSDKKIISYLGNLGLPKSSLDNEYAEFIIKAFRYDARSFYRYFYNQAGKKQPLIKTSCHCIVGEKDAITKNPLKKYRAWGQYCSNPTLHVIKDADHYFINSQANDLAEIIYTEVQKSVSTDKA